MNFRPGDVVRLKSGGPRMTVVSVAHGTDGTPMVDCMWFHENERKDGIFREAVLEKDV